MRFCLRLGQVFKFTCFDGDQKYLFEFPAKDTKNRVIYEVCNKKFIHSYFEIEEKDGWTRKVNKETDPIITDRAILDSEFKVIEVQYISTRVYEYSNYVIAASINNNKKIVRFFQHEYPCETRIPASEVQLISGPEDKFVSLKKGWVEIQ